MLRGRKKASKKRMGRPPTGAGKPVMVRLQPAMYAAVKAWIARQPAPTPTIPEAVRRLVDKALACEARMSGNE
jgi:hypothetical protein